MNKNSAGSFSCTWLVQNQWARGCQGTTQQGPLFQKVRFYRTPGEELKDAAIVCHICMLFWVFPALLRALDNLPDMVCSCDGF